MPQVPDSAKSIALDYNQSQRAPFTMRGKAAKQVQMAGSCREKSRTSTRKVSESATRTLSWRKPPFPRARKETVKQNVHKSRRLSFKKDEANQPVTQDSLQDSRNPHEGGQNQKRAAVDEQSRESSEIPATMSPEGKDQGVELVSMRNSNGKEIIRILLSDKSKAKAQKDYGTSNANDMHVAVSTRTEKKGGKRVIIPMVAVLRKKPVLSSCRQNLTSNKQLANQTPLVQKPESGFSLRRLLRRQQTEKKIEGAFVPSINNSSMPPIILADRQSSSGSTTLSSLIQLGETILVSEAHGLRPLGIVEHDVYETQSNTVDEKSAYTGTKEISQPSALAEASTSVLPTKSFAGKETPLKEIETKEHNLGPVVKESTPVGEAPRSMNGPQDAREKTLDVEDSEVEEEATIETEAAVPHEGPSSRDTTADVSRWLAASPVAVASTLGAIVSFCTGISDRKAPTKKEVLNEASSQSNSSAIKRSVGSNISLSLKPLPDTLPLPPSLDEHKMEQEKRDLVRNIRAEVVANNQVTNEEGSAISAPKSKFIAATTKPEAPLAASTSLCGREELVEDSIDPPVTAKQHRRLGDNPLPVTDSLKESTLDSSIANESHDGQSGATEPISIPKAYRSSVPTAQNNMEVASEASSVIEDLRDGYAAFGSSAQRSVSVDWSRTQEGADYEVLGVFELPGVPSGEYDDEIDEDRRGEEDNETSDRYSPDQVVEWRKFSFSMDESLHSQTSKVSKHRAHEEAKVESAIKVFQKHARMLGVDERDLLVAVQQSYADGASASSSISSKFSQF